MDTIAVFHPSNELYGADRIMVNALAALPDDTRKIVYLRADGPLQPYIKEHVQNVEVVIFPGLPIIYRSAFGFAGIFRLLRQLIKFYSFMRKEQRKHQFRSAYVNTLSCSFLLPILSILRIRNFVHVHEIIDSPKSIGWITTRLASLYSDQIVCVSKAVENGMLRYSRRVHQKIMVLHNGISPIMTSSHHKNHRIHFYLFGRIMPKKGQWFLLESVAQIPREKLEYCLFTIKGGVLKGNEHLLKELVARIKELRLMPYVRIEEFDPSINEAMGKADVCLVPSLMKDPFPTTVLEAMSAGKPVIGTNHGGASEAIEDGITGRLVAPRDTVALSQAIEELIDQRELIALRGQRGKDRFQRLFTLERFKQDWTSFMLQKGFA